MSARRTSQSNAAPVVLGMFVAIAAFVGGTLVERSTGASPIEAAVTDREPARTPPVPRIAVYGDSLVVQSEPYFAAIGRALGTRVSTRAHGGIAPCDALGWLADDLAQTSPDIVVFAFSGNSLTDCMRQGDGSLATDDAIVARYRDDLEFAIRMSVSAGTPFVLASPPASQSSPEDWLRIDELYRDVVARHAPYAQYADAGLDIAPGGRFVTEQRCLPFELSVPEVSGTCDTDNPTISVRAEDGVHFCGDVVEGTAGACTTYSSGALRYAVALVTAAKIDLEYMASVPDIVPQRVGSP